jgi:serine protease Do
MACNIDLEEIMHRSQTLRLTVVPALLVTMMLLLSVAVTRAASQADIDILDRSGKALSSMVKEVRPSVVHISVSSTVDVNPEFEQFFNNPFFERFFGPEFRQQDPRQRKRQQQGTGSGFIISKDGRILTNNHVVEKADKITVTLSDNSKVEAELIGTDPQSDLALIKVDVEEELPVLPLGDSDALEVGEWVIAIGNPFGLSQTVTVGVVSATGRSRMGINEYENFIQTDAAINPGNSGGPLLNIHGEVIGINSALYSRTGGYMGIGFAIPINMAKSIEDQLQKYGKVTRGWLGVGIQNLDDTLAGYFGLDKAEGVLITEVYPDTPAEKAGIEREDIVLELNGERLKDSSDLRNRIALTTPKSDATLRILRDGKTTDITVTIGALPEDFGNFVRNATSKDLLGDYGLVLQELTPELAEQLGYNGRQGVIITEVNSQSSAEGVGLKPGQLIEEVNKRRVTNLDELDRVLQESDIEGRVLLRVRAGDISQYVVLRSE